MVVSAYLRGLRLSFGRTLKDAAGVIGASIAKASRMETGQSPPRPEGAMALLRYYEVDPSQAAAIRELLLQDTVAVRGQRATDAAPGWAVRLAAVERQAIAIRTAAMGVVPGPCRTAAYASAVMTSWRGSRLGPADAEALTHRGLLGNGGGPPIHAVLDEVALTRQIADSEVAAAQVRELKLAAAAGRADLRALSRGCIVPGGALTELVLHGPGGPRRLIVHEAPHGALYLAAPDDVENYRSVMDSLLARSLPSQLMERRTAGSPRE